MGEDRIAPQAASAMRTAIRLAGGNEVCFAATLDASGIVISVRAIARGDISSVLALPGAVMRGEMLIHNHPSGILVPSSADMNVASSLHSNGVGFGIVDNNATRLYVVAELPTRSKEIKIDPASISVDLGPGGQIADLMRSRSAFGYEDRPAQRDMALNVTNAFNDGSIALLEAGTGVGKSMGYLVPTLRWAAANGERTVVSTATITLQEQLISKDLPFLASALKDQSVHFTLLKGWHNYICLNRLEQAVSSDQSLFDAPSISELKRIHEWADQTSDGTLADINPYPKLEVWDEVSAESDLCPRMKCAHYDDCFLFRARQEAAMADVVVVNHHLLLADIAVRRTLGNWEEAAVLPSYRRVIVDEGHQLHEAASAHLGVSTTRRAIMRLLGRLERKNGKGLLPILETRLAASDDLLSIASLDLVRLKLIPATNRARESTQKLFEFLRTVVEQSGENAATVRIDESFKDHEVWTSGLDDCMTDLLTQIAELRDGLQLVRERMETDSALSEKHASVLSELRAVVRRLDSSSDALIQVLRPVSSGEQMVRWLEIHGKGNDKFVAAKAVPLNLAPILRTDLFDRVETAVITSATLATSNGFTYLESSLGLSNTNIPLAELNGTSQITDVVMRSERMDRLKTATFKSQFSYESQAILAIPSDTQAPNNSASSHSASVHTQLRDLASASDGGVLALFTSYRDLNTAAMWWRSQKFDSHWPLLVQGENETRDVLLQRFRDSGRAVLLGTASFWEGIDIPGPALRALLISKLPFSVPTDPMVSAQCEAIEARGGDPFREFMLPNASLRLKQGFGRLIRTGSDRGAIVISDPRIATKGYGKRLLDALPPARRLIGPWNVILPSVQSFYRS